ncbi:tRNA uridine-5-carboxymethylaminomethyl(34) synthesis enzyme MnmG [Candidatus Sumerlaeota bacterium]|nr:tRNA uridine-5-carboxymethylaminomethyl(34) synthesis enzyme MnmG [Candidatus Sumerlaeota bacterium]
MFADRYEIIVVGGGHAGAEAAAAAARMGCQTLLLTLDVDAIARMSCNPAIGGLGKSQIVLELDALGGMMGMAADATGIQFRQLNTRKGPAVQAPRCQSDKWDYERWVQAYLRRWPNLTVAQGEATGLIIESCRATGVRLKTGESLKARAVILTTGTFLDGKLHFGMESVQGGRIDEPAAIGLGESLREAGLEIRRLKTGTPARLHRDSIDYSVCEVQHGDPEPVPFSFRTDRIDVEQVPCHITHTNARTHEIILGSLDQSPLFTGKIEGVGPRYCPSIEDKCVRFKDKERHQIFLEPEGRNAGSVYPNGISTSLPREVQERYVRSIHGLENARFLRYGYAVEYTYVPPIQLKPTFETKTVPGLYLAGQINATTGYEEAAGQGLHAAINAVLTLRGEEPFVLKRNEAYLGVMIDDLITKEHREPYRMFTARAEYRLLLRCDNADLRLCEDGRRLGLLEEEQYARFQRHREQVEGETQRLRTTIVRPSELDRDTLARLELKNLENSGAIAQLLARPDMTYEALIELGLGSGEIEPRARRQIEIQIRYAGYIARQQAEIDRHAALESQPIPDWIDYAEVRGLTNEAREKLNAVRPVSIGQAGRIPGVNPADISVLLIFLKRRNALRSPESL